VSVSKEAEKGKKIMFYAQPLINGVSCQVSISEETGRLGIRLDDGSELDTKDVIDILRKIVPAFQKNPNLVLSCIFSKSPDSNTLWVYDLVDEEETTVENFKEKSTKLWTSLAGCDIIGSDDILTDGGSGPVVYVDALECVDDATFEMLRFVDLEYKKMTK
jgi:hypothetical protein